MQIPAHAGELLPVGSDVDGDGETIAAAVEREPLPALGGEAPRRAHAIPPQHARQIEDGAEQEPHHADRQREPGPPPAGLLLELFLEGHRDPRAALRAPRLQEARPAPVSIRPSRAQDVFMRASDWFGFGALAALIVSVVALASGRPGWALASFLLGAVAALLTRHWSTKHPGPMPYALRWTLRVPRGNQSPEHLRRALEPRARRAHPRGRPRGRDPRAAGRGRARSRRHARHLRHPAGDARRRDAPRAVAPASPTSLRDWGAPTRCPTPTAPFDGAYLVGVLGEIPNGPAALRELHRVLKPQGRLVIGEIFFDPEFVRLGALAQLAERRRVRARAKARQLAHLPGALPLLTRGQSERSEQRRPGARVCERRAW